MIKEEWYYLFLSYNTFHLTENGDILFTEAPSGPPLKVTLNAIARDRIEVHWKVGVKMIKVNLSLDDHSLLLNNSQYQPVRSKMTKIHIFTFWLFNQQN